jgi:large subunit ribosomal protein L31e
MAKEEINPIILQREYIIPLRREILKVPAYKRARRAIKAIKAFIAKHMKIEDREVKKVKIDRWLNEEIWFRGIKKPPVKIKVIAKKYLDYTTVELAEIPQIVKFRIDREKRQKEKIEGKKKEEKKEEKPAEEVKEAEKTEEEKEKKEDMKEKKAAVKEAGLEQAQKAAKQVKHLDVDKKVRPHRMALKK